MTQDEHELVGDVASYQTSVYRNGTERWVSYGLRGTWSYQQVLYTNTSATLLSTLAISVLSGCDIITVDSDFTLSVKSGLLVNNPSYIYGYYINTKSKFNVTMDKNSGSTTTVSLTTDKIHLNCTQTLSTGTCGQGDKPARNSQSEPLVMAEVYFVADGNNVYTWEGSYYFVSGRLFTCNKIGR